MSASPLLPAAKHSSLLQQPIRLMSLLLAGLVLPLAGCGNSGGSGSNPKPAGSTTVTLLLSSTANDRIAQAYAQLTTLTLTTAAGKQVTFTAPVTTTNTLAADVEYMHLNGNSEPLVTASVPDDTYVSATATVSSTQFSCTVLLPGTLSTNTYQINDPVVGSMTVSLASPLVVQGTAMGLVLNLQVAKSFTYPSCAQTGTPVFSSSPVFTLSPVSFASSAAQAVSLNETGSGLVTATANGGGSVTVQAADGLTFPVNTTSATVFQGVASAAAVTPGMTVAVDWTIASDGSLSASRLAVLSTNTSQISNLSGPLLFVGNGQPVGQILAAMQGFLFTKYQTPGSQPFSFGSSTFTISAAPALLANLPFTPVFNAQTMIPGQNVLLTSNAASSFGGPVYTPASTTSLLPQTVDGSITSVATAGQFTVYTVSLNPLSLFPQLAVQPGQASLIANPGSVSVYVGPAAQSLNLSSPAVGGVFRFTGLIFDDNGTLRMACSEINDGVAQ